jgi:hypothetical protein
MVEDILAVFGVVGLALALRSVWRRYKMRPHRRSRSAPDEMYPRWNVAGRSETAIRSASGPRRERSAPAEMYPRWKV